MTFSLFEEHFMDLIPIIQRMRTPGMKVNVPLAAKQHEILRRALLQLEAYWAKMFPSIDYSSNIQLRNYFYKVKKIPEITERRGKDGKRTATVNEDALNIIATKYGVESARLVILMRKIKDASEFFTRFNSEGWARPTWKIHGQANGRLQAKDPNVNNIPEEMLKSDNFDGVHPREVYIPDTEEDTFLYFDFEQIEHWLTCWYAGDTDYLRMKEEGIYIHGVNLEEIFKIPFFQPGMPKVKKYRLPSVKPQDLLRAKAVRHGFNNGRGWKSLADECNKSGIPMSYEEAREYQNRDRRTHPAIYEFHEKVVGTALRQGFLQNAFGRIRPFSGTERTDIVAFMQQSTAADVLIRNALRGLSPTLWEFGPRCRIIFSGHDSCLINVPKKHKDEIARFVRQKTTEPIPQLNGFRMDIELFEGPNWYDLSLME